MSDCLFCKIIRGEIPSFKVYEDEKTLAFLDISPVNPGHTLVIPKNHSKNIFDISEEDWVSVGKAVRTLASAVEKAVGADGININMNNRPDAGQLVDHTHVHLIPRKKGDGLKLWPQKPYPEGEAESIVEKIRLEI
ncbi:HIT family hydrolase [Candidatus Kaiserbacteria bacterium RIFCSPHIGHO2_01_FULL_53_29]|uniref:HIT family hydrolase n=1 Tax=Candidatus Kaiserbacteria bacterium RIFCSPHIGHO2_01_FULL_53_29 TaxID=1798480 RepID=A0A1F6CW28_9BACT|nr:MAG: HIT family hydrolase [Candidatus Kaiserbacteria bacterium RIFCSPHIGHO2_01_FULL_53_29]